MPRDDGGVKKEAPLPKDEPIQLFPLLISKSASRSRAVSKMFKLEMDTRAFRCIQHCVRAFGFRTCARCVFQRCRLKLAAAARWRTAASAARLLALVSATTLCTHRQNTLLKIILINLALMEAAFLPSTIISHPFTTRAVRQRCMETNRQSTWSQQTVKIIIHEASIWFSASNSPCSFVHRTNM